MEQVKLSRMCWLILQRRKLTSTRSAVFNLANENATVTRNEFCKRVVANIKEVGKIIFELRKDMKLRFIWGDCWNIQEVVDSSGTNIDFKSLANEYTPTKQDLQLLDKIALVKLEAKQARSEHRQTLRSNPLKYLNTYMLQVFQLVDSSSDMEALVAELERSNLYFNPKFKYLMKNKFFTLEYYDRLRSKLYEEEIKEYKDYIISKSEKAIHKILKSK
jgi:hypothetical protein